MLSAQSIQNLASLFERAARATLLRSQEDACQITTAPSSAPAGDRLLIITTSSFAFRLLTIFHIADNETNRAYFLAPGAAGSLQDALSEVVNLCCGAFNREIACVFPHLGMSVPTSLSAECVDYLRQLKPAHTSQLTVSINSEVHVNVTLCMCCTGPIEIPATLAVAAQTSGELEMF